MEVDGEVAGSYATLQEAVGASADKTATIYVNGDSTETGQISIRGNTNITIIPNGNYTATLSENASVSYAFLYLNGYNSTSSLTIGYDGCPYTWTVDANRIDSVIYLQYGSSLTLEDGACLTGGKSGINGGGICADYGTVTMNGGSITGNTARDGGGVYMRSTSATQIAQFTMNGGSISYNTASLSGGGVYNISNAYNTYDAVFTMNGGTISNNTSSGNGGGVFNSRFVNMTMTAGEIRDNEAGALGGGLYLYNTGAHQDGLSLTGGSISGNKAADGGGIYSYYTNLHLHGISISGNNAQRGGGIFLEGDVLTFYDGAELTGNQATDRGSAVWTYNNDPDDGEDAQIDMYLRFCGSPAIEGTIYMYYNLFPVYVDDAYNGSTLQFDLNDTDYQGKDFEQTGNNFNWSPLAGQQLLTGDYLTTMSDKIQIVNDSAYYVNSQGVISLREITLTPGTADGRESYKNGDTVTVPITAAGYSGQGSSFNFTIKYDPADLKYTDIASALPGDMTVTEEEGAIKIEYTGGFTLSADSNVLATLTFQVSNTSLTEDKTSVISLTDGSVTLQEGGAAITPVTASASILLDAPDAPAGGSDSSSDDGTSTGNGSGVSNSTGGNGTGGAGVSKAAKTGDYSGLAQWAVLFILAWTALVTLASRRRAAK